MPSPAAHEGARDVAGDDASGAAQWGLAAERLRSGCAALGLPLPVPVQEQMLAYLRLLQHWNRAYNLTAVRQPADMVTRHLLDSLALLPSLDAAAPPNLLDLGSGAGLPGLPLALARPRLAVTLLDADGKRIRFLRHVVAALAMAQVTVLQARAEAYAHGERFAIVAARAVAGPDRLAQWAEPMLAPGGALWVMAGRLAELTEPSAQSGFGPPTVVPLTVPGLSGERHLVIYRRQAA